MSTGDRLARVLAALAAHDGTAATIPDRVCLTAVRLAEVTGAAVSLIGASGSGASRYGAMLAATDEVAERLESLHLTVAEGPGLDAHDQGQPVFETDLAGATPDRWPAFSDYALGAGVRAVFAFPLRIGAIRLGVLGLYRTTAGPLPEAGFADALLLAGIAAQAVLGVLGEPSPGGPDHSVRPVALRAQVHQATGMVAVQLGVTMENAFARLQAHAYAEGRLIGDVAADVVARLLRFNAAPAE